MVRRPGLLDRRPRLLHLRGRKETTGLSKRVGHEVPSVVVWPLLLHRGLGWEMLGDISYDKATLQSEGK